MIIKQQDPEYLYQIALQYGLDYNAYGTWQKNYAEMILNICDIHKRTGKEKPSIMDVGCACGTVMRAFKEMNMFGSIRGCDISKFMLDLGKKNHGFSDEELLFASGDNLPMIENNSIDFIHCTQTLEHCEESNICLILNEFKRIIQPNGIVFISLPAIKDGCPEEFIKLIEDHITVKTVQWWEDVFSKNFKIIPEIFKKYKNAPYSPNNSDKTYYDYYHNEWAVFLLTKRPNGISE